MTANVGRFDRIIRAVIGLALMAIWFGYLGLGVGAPWDWILGLIGAVLVATAILSVCPAYALFGIRTCER